MTRRRKPPRKTPPKGVTWCDRSLIDSFTYYGLCTNEDAFFVELERMGIPRADRPVWVSPGANASTHFFENNREHRKCALVCMGDAAAERSGVQIAALLVHEAMHVWRAIREDIGEFTPSVEFEAYAMQSIAQNLMHAYCDAVLGKP